jgi:DNA polymerase III subunit alpha
MVKIISKKSLGVQAVYDIGVELDHNFLLVNGLVASNCFNKSHSTAYGYVTFQTTYLKANYPVEYMAALLTANSGDQDKLQRYIGDCIAMGISVDPPDINCSGIDFTPLSTSILFGLSAVRNVGTGAIDDILQARAQGEFKSLADLCDRIDPRVVNRRALESLIKSGAMDIFDKNRNQLLHDVELILEWSASRAKDRASGQGNLFDMLGGSSVEELPEASFETAPKAPPVEDFEPTEKLKYEKELLGFYLSDHPLKAVQSAARVLAPVSMANLDSQPDNITLSAIVMLTEVKKVVTKKGDNMAILQIEDLTGKAEAVVFPKSYERIGAKIVVDQRMMIWGKVDRRDDRGQFIIEDAEPIEEVRYVVVDIDPETAADIQMRQRLKDVLQKQTSEAAKIPVVAKIGNDNQSQYVRLGVQFRVNDDLQTVRQLAQAGFNARTTSLVGV